MQAHEATVISLQRDRKCAYESKEDVFYVFISSAFSISARLLSYQEPFIRRLSILFHSALIAI